MKNIGQLLFGLAFLTTITILAADDPHGSAAAHDGARSDDAEARQADAGQLRGLDLLVPLQQGGPREPQVCPVPQDVLGQPAVRLRPRRLRPARW